jgi:hypothetical protein
MRTTFLLVAAAALGAGVSGAAAAPIAGPVGTGIDRADSLVSNVQWRRYGYYGPRYGYYGRRYGPGAAAAGVVGGLAAGALIGGALAGSAAAPPPPPAVVDPGVARWCRATYGRYFDPVTGTFLAADGQRYVCTPG